MPVSIVFSLSSIFILYNINDPRTVGGLVILVLQVTSLIMQNQFTDTLFQKNIPSDIRGSMMGVY
jgi:hypothetical protein